MTAEHSFAEFTDSESHLDRAVAIATYCSDSPHPIRTMFRLLARDYSVKSEKVARRHVKLAEKLELIGLSDATVRLLGPGRALVRLDRSAEKDTSGLTRFDRAYMLLALFQFAPLQTVKVLQAVDESTGGNLQAVVIKFLSLDGTLPWRKEQLQGALDDFLQTCTVSRLFEHKVSCRLNWLRQLGLVTTGWPARPTQRGSEVLSHWEPKSETIDLKPIDVAAVALGYRPKVVTPKEAERDGMIVEVGELATQQASSLGMASYEEVRRIISIRLLADHGAILAPDTFKRIVNDAWRQGLVRSVQDDRRGRPGTIVPRIPTQDSPT